LACFDLSTSPEEVIGDVINRFFAYGILLTLNKKHNVNLEKKIEFMAYFAPMLCAQANSASYPQRDAK